MASTLRHDFMPPLAEWIVRTRVQLQSERAVGQIARGFAFQHREPSLQYSWFQLVDETCLVRLSEVVV
jgi:hypothetical protein